MITFSADEIFEIAEQIERNGANFYRKAAESAEGDNRNLLLRLAKMEDDHEKIFATMRAEFAKAGGKTWLEIIYDKTDPKNLQAELDTYWVQAGGGDPAEWIRKYAGRLSVLHIKDMIIASGDQQRFAEIGEGNLNWPAILAAAKDAGVEWYCVEQDDCYDSDPFDALKISLENLHQMGLK